MKSTSTGTPPSGPLARLPWAVWLLPWLVLAAALWWWAWPGLMQRACWMGEWPFEDGCPSMPRGADSNHPPAVYQQHLQQNIGDSRALAWLTAALWQQDDPRAQELLPWAAQLAPNHPYLLAIQADAQVQAQDWGPAIESLVALLERGQARARPALLRLMAAAETQELVLARLSPQSQWLDPLLASLDRATPASALLPFVSAGSELGLLQPATVLGLVDRLKAEGAWIDAYTLWVGWSGGVRPGLYNASFDRPALRRGFDWEWPRQPAHKQGFRIDQIPASPNPGAMLELQLTGRGALPAALLAQTLVLPGPRYRLRGNYLSDRLSTKEGLVWAWRCAAGGERWAQTPPIVDTQRQWATFDLIIEPPPACGAAVQLRLETTAAWEARAGMTGAVYFDNFSLAPHDAAAPAQEQAPAQNRRRP